ncbi:MAG: hypothetical protein ACJ8AD_19800 [Gemmatimonadaceae bacterium]
MTSPPLACVPGAIPARERAAHFALLTRLFGRSARSRERLPDGYRYRFDGDALDDLTAFVVNERRCCPFLSFTLEIGPSEGPILLQLTGPAGVHEFLDAELPAIL